MIVCAVHSSGEVLQGLRLDSGLLLTSYLGNRDLAEWQAERGPVRLLLIRSPKNFTWLWFLTIVNGLVQSALLRTSCLNWTNNAFRVTWGPHALLLINDVNPSRSLLCEAEQLSMMLQASMRSKNDSSHRSGEVPQALLFIMAIFTPPPPPPPLRHQP